jgi:hypothetical protein
LSTWCWEERFQSIGNTEDGVTIIRVNPRYSDKFNFLVTYSRKEIYRQERLSAFYITPRDYGQKVIPQLYGTIQATEFTDDILFLEGSGTTLEDESHFAWRTEPPAGVKMWRIGATQIKFESNQHVVGPIAMIFWCS